MAYIARSGARRPKNLALATAKRPSEITHLESEKSVIIRGRPYFPDDETISPKPFLLVKKVLSCEVHSLKKNPCKNRPKRSRFGLPRVLGTVLVQSGLSLQNLLNFCVNNSMIPKQF